MKVEILEKVAERGEENVSLSPLEQAGRIIKCGADPLEWFKHVKIQDATLKKMVEFEMWPHLRRFIMAVYRKHLVIVLKAKQIGISWTMAGVALHICYQPGAKILMLSKGKDEAKELLEKARIIHQNLPEWLKMKLVNDDVFFLKFANGSSIMALSSTADAGVGYTASLVIADENEFHDYAKENYGNVKATVDAGAWMIIASTTEKTKTNTHFKTLFSHAKQGINNFYPMFFGVYSRPGRNHEWYTRTQRDYTSALWEFHQNYPRNESEALSPVEGKMAVDMELLKRQLLFSEKAVTKESRVGGACKVYAFEQPSTFYIAGVDASEGKGNDYQALRIMGQEGLIMEDCLVMWTNNLTVDIFAYEAYKFLNQYYQPNLVCGADAWGQAFLKCLVEYGYPTEKIYSTNPTKKLGYQETYANKKTNMADMEVWLKNVILRHKESVYELMSVYYEDGEPKVPEGSHDDLVVSLKNCMVGFKAFKNFGEKVVVERYY